jgi:DNA replication protein DnaC
MSDRRSLKEILADCTTRFVPDVAPAGEPARPAPKQEAPSAAPENRTIPSFRWATLDAGELRTRVSRGRAIVDAAAALTSTGLLLVGPSGSGKTSLACALLRAWDARYPRRRGVFMPAWKLGVARAQHGLGQGEPPEVERALTTRLLVLDDLGSERNTATNAVPDVIFARALDGLPTWVTTWMTAEAVTQRYGDGIARRLYEAGRLTVIACGSAG